MKIGVYHNCSDKITGCWKVTWNLINGLKELGVEVIENGRGDYNGVIQDCFDRYSVPGNALIGPEIFVLPTEKSGLLATFKNWVQPSKWVIEYQKQFAETRDNNMYAWPVGVDTERFNDKNRRPKYDCFIYLKSVTRRNENVRLEDIESYLKRYKYTYKIIKYGDYSEPEFMDLVNRCMFGIWFVGSESQNIALLECLAMGCPVYVIDQNMFYYKDFTFKGCSSAPYFDYRCGVKRPDFADIERFAADIDKYKPREYVTDNHTLARGAQKYLDILEKHERINI